MHVVMLQPSLVWGDSLPSPITPTWASVFWHNRTGSWCSPPSILSCLVSLKRCSGAQRKHMLAFILPAWQHYVTMGYLAIRCNWIWLNWEESMRNQASRAVWSDVNEPTGLSAPTCRRFAALIHKTTKLCWQQSHKCVYIPTRRKES